MKSRLGPVWRNQRKMYIRPHKSVVRVIKPRRTLSEQVLSPFICIICIRVSTHMGGTFAPRREQSDPHHTLGTHRAATRRQICASLFRDHEPRGTFNKFTTSHIETVKKENNKRENKQLPTTYDATVLLLVCAAEQT